MPRFVYTGRDAQGHRVAGKAEGGSLDAMAGQLQKQGIVPLTIKEVKEQTGASADWSKMFKIRLMGGVKTEDLVIFCQEMYTMMKASVGIVDAFKRIIQTTHSKGIENALQDAIVDVSSGFALSTAFSRHPEIFSPMFTSVVEAGETTGNLEAVFLQLSGYLELEASTKKRIKAALRYPTILVTSIFAALLVINFLLIPNFARLFSGFGVALPLPTRILMATSHFLMTYWFYVAILLVVVGLSLYFQYKTESGRAFWDKWRLRLPVFGHLLYRLLLVRFSRALATMMKADVPLINSLVLSANTVDNAYIAERIASMKDALDHGENFMQAAVHSGLFKPLILQMLSVGDESAAVDEMLLQIAGHYEREVNYDLKRLTDLMEPILLLVMGAMVLLLAFGVFLPMWNMVNLIK